MSETETENETRQPPSKNWLEWSVFVVSLVLVAGVIGYLVYGAATQGDAPPDVRVRLGATVPRGETFLVPIETTNVGDEMAQAVHVEVLLEATGAESEERAELTIDFIPRRATRDGWATFTRDPRGGRLSARAVGYEKP